MSAKQASSTEQLLRASFDDEEVLQLPLPDSIFGLHAQQAVEKLYKALLVHQQGSYPYSHDLASLRKRVETAGMVIPKMSFRLENLSEYAGNARYDDPIAIDEAARELLRNEIRSLREFVAAALKNP